MRVNACVNGYVTLSVLGLIIIVVDFFFFILFFASISLSRSLQSKNREHLLESGGRPVCRTVALTNL